MPLIMVFRLLGLLLAAYGLLDLVLAFAPAGVAALVPGQLKLAEGFQAAANLLGVGAAVYLLSEVAARRPSKSY